MKSTVTDNMVIGRSYLSNTGNGDSTSVKTVYTHPGFTQFPPKDDLSLLHLDKSVELGSVDNSFPYFQYFPYSLYLPSCLEVLYVLLKLNNYLKLSYILFPLEAEVPTQTFYFDVFLINGGREKMSKKYINSFVLFTLLTLLYPVRLAQILRSLNHQVFNFLYIYDLVKSCSFWMFI